MLFLIDVTILLGAPTGEDAWRQVNAAVSAEEFAFDVIGVSKPDLDTDGEVYAIDVTLRVEADEAEQAWQHVAELARAEEFPFEISNVDEPELAAQTS